MRLLESIYVVTLLVVVGLCCFPVRHAPRAFSLPVGHPEAAMVGLAVLLLIAHAFVEGIHWQMVPAYLAILPLGWAAIHPGHHVDLALIAGSALLITLVFHWLVPMFRFALLSGPYPVGTSVHYLVDHSRTEDADAAANHARELMIQAWYPAAPSRRRFAAYRRRLETTAVSSYHAVLKTRSREHAPVAITDRPVPVLVFHPAWNGRRTQNTFLTEDLASHGFLVVAMDHPFNSEPVALPDGRVVRAPHMRAIEDVSSSSAEEVKRIGCAEVGKQAKDNAFLLDTLASWNEQQGSPWFGKIDLGRCGVFGHSLGGAVAIECLRLDARVGAALNMDGWTFGNPVRATEREFHNGQSIYPALLVFREHSPYADSPQGAGSKVEEELNSWDDSNVSSLLEEYGGYCLKLRGANHLNYTDRPISSPWRRLSGGGEISPRRAHRILCDVVLGFFAQAFLVRPAGWLDDPSARYGELEPHTKRASTASVNL